MKHFRREVGIRGALWFATGDIAWKMTTFVVLASVSRGASDVSAMTLVLAQTVFLLLVAAGDLGFRALGTRLVALTCDSAQVLQIYRWVQVQRHIAAFVVGLPVAAIAIAVLSDGWAVAMALAFLTVCWLPYFTVGDWSLLALQRFRELAIARITCAVVILFATMLSVYYGGGIWGVGLGYAIGFSISGWMTARKMREITPAAPLVLRQDRAVASKADLSELTWRSSIVLATAFAMNAVFHSQETLLSGWLLGTEVAATYGAAFRIVVTVYSFSWLATQYLSPRFARATDASMAGYGLGQRRGINLIVFAGALALVVALSAGELCRWLYGEKFADGADVVFALSTTVVLDSAVSMLGTMLVMLGAARASLVSIAAGCGASAATFAFAAMANQTGLDVPVAAKYVGYLTLLTSQIWYLTTSKWRGRTSSGS